MGFIFLFLLQKIRNGRDAPKDRRKYKTAACNTVWFSDKNTAAPGKSPLEATSLQARITANAAYLDSANDHSTGTARMSPAARGIVLELA